VTDATLVLISSRRRIKFLIFFVENFFFMDIQTHNESSGERPELRGSIFFQNTDYEV